MRSVSDAFIAAARESHTIVTRVEVLAAGAIVLELDSVTAGEVTLDQTAATRGRCDLTVIDDGTLGLVPTTPDDPLTPYGNELRIWRGIDLPAGPELISLGIFRIEEVAIEDTAAGLQLQISGQDRSARIIDARLEEPYQVAAGTNYETAISDVLISAWPDIEVDLTPTTRTTPQLIANEGDDRWAFAQALATAIGHVLYFDGNGVAVTRPVTNGGAPVLSIAEGDDGVLVTAQRRWHRQGTYNRVIATGENTGDAAPARGVATDSNPLSPTYYHGQYGRVPRFYSSPFITTDAQASDAAEAILSQELGTTQQVAFGAVTNPALEPSDIVTITRERSGIDEEHVIDQLTIPLLATEAMNGRTRATAVA
jgi:hypothetical protein